MKRKFLNGKTPTMYDLYIMKGEVKDVDTKKGIVTGYGSKFGNIDSDFDMIMPGAFSKTITENGPGAKNQRIYHLRQHDRDKLLGKPYILKEDDYGLYFENEVVKTSLGKDSLLLYEAGIFNEHSIGYNVVNFKEEKDHYKLTELKLFEISAVTWGSNSETPTVGMKTEDRKALVLDQFSRVRNLIKNGNLLEEETFFFLENILVNLESEIKTLFTSLKAEPAPSGMETTFEGKEPLEVDTILNAFFKHFKN
jgi:hypothetical protein